MISLRDIVNINKLTLILKNIGQCDVKHDVTDKNIGQCDVKHDITDTNIGQCDVKHDITDTNIGQCDVKHDITDTNNNVSVEGLDMHYQKYHGLLYQTL